MFEHSFGCQVVLRRAPKAGHEQYYYPWKCVLRDRAAPVSFLHNSAQPSLSTLFLIRSVLW